MPQIKQKVVDEFGILPVKHEITVNGSNPVVIEADLPPVFDDILDSASCGCNVMMTGPAGTGKGFMARQVAKALEAEFYEVNAVGTEYGLTGFVDANSNYVKTPFYDACKASSEGKKVIFLFDEMDCSDATSLKVFNEALEAREFTFPNNEKLNFEDMVIMSACNTYGTGADEMYTGNVIDASTRNRFVMIKVDYNRKVEERLAEGDEQLCDFIDTFRTQVEKCGLKEVISYRNIKQITQLKRTSMTLKKIMQIALVKSIAEDDLRNILSNMDFMSSNIYYRATKGENVMVA
jgi:MoxR-like ATPase